MPFVTLHDKNTLLEQCWWYHSLDFPDGSQVSGDWDLRGRFADYTGGVPIEGRRVLDVGTASGFLSFSAEREGARVVSFDMPIDGDWDMVPFADEILGAMGDAEVEARLSARRKSEAVRYKRVADMKALRNGYFYAHKKFGSRVELFEGNIYSIDAEVGYFDVAFVGAILLHLRDPFLALYQIAQATTRQLVISDLCDSGFRQACQDKPILEFLPDKARVHTHAWWRLSPGAMTEMLRVVGFAVTREATKTYKFQGRDLEMVTIVADRIAV